VEEQILKMVEEVADTDEAIGPATDLLDTDILDSFAFIELLTRLETAFGVEIQPTQVPADSWHTVHSIAALVTLLQQK